MVFGIFWLSASIVIGKIRDNRILAVALVLVAILAGASLLITAEDIDSRLAFNHEKDSFLESINNDSNVIVYNTDYGYRILHTDLNKTKQYTISDKYFYSDDVEICKDLDKIIRDNPDKTVYLVNWNNADKNKKYEDKYDLKEKYDSGHYTFYIVK